MEGFQPSKEATQGSKSCAGQVLVTIRLAADGSVEDKAVGRGLGERRQSSPEEREVMSEPGSNLSEEKGWRVTLGSRLNGKKGD
jgi:hypothetical protein